MSGLKGNTLFVGWREPARNAWFPVGRLDVDLGKPWYRFRHVKGAERARSTGRFDLVPGFPELRGDYGASALFPVFRNRVLSPRRPDFAEYLEILDLSPAAEPIEALWVDGGRRMTDRLDVFPGLVKEADGSFVCRFFPTDMDDRRADGLEPGHRLRLAVDDRDNGNGAAVPVRTDNQRLVGWVPPCFAEDVRMALLESRGAYEAMVVRVNHAPHPWSLSVLVEMRSRWDNHEPMSGEDFEPLA